MFFCSILLTRLTDTLKKASRGGSVARRSFSAPEIESRPTDMPGLQELTGEVIHGICTEKSGAIAESLNLCNAAVTRKQQRLRTALDRCLRDISQRRQKAEAASMSDTDRNGGPDDFWRTPHCKN